jgi:hypothetical protein
MTEKKEILCAMGLMAGMPTKPTFAPNEKEIKLCMDWIKEMISPRKTINTKYSSYYLKHKVEDWLAKKPENNGFKNENTYVSNGAFIQAAINLGYKYKQGCDCSLNANFNMSFKKIAKLLRGY